MRWLALGLLILVLSCCPQRMLTTSTDTSTTVQVVERLVEVRDTVTVEIMAEKESVILPDTVSSYLENAVAESWASLEDGALYHTLTSKPQSIKQEVITEVLVRDSIVYNDRVITDYIEVERDLNWFQQTSIYGFWVLVSFILIIIGIRYKTMFI